MQSYLALVKEIGATHTIDTTSFTDFATDLPAAVRKIVPKGTNMIINTTGVVPLISGAVKTLHARGQIILIGIVNGETMDLDLGELLNVSRLSRVAKIILKFLSSALQFVDALKEMRSRQRWASQKTDWLTFHC